MWCNSFVTWIWTCSCMVLLIRISLSSSWIWTCMPALIYSLFVSSSLKLKRDPATATVLKNKHTYVHTINERGPDSSNRSTWLGLTSTPTAYGSIDPPILMMAHDCQGSLASSLTGIVLWSTSCPLVWLTRLASLASHRRPASWHRGTLLKKNDASLWPLRVQWGMHHACCIYRIR